jgi:hypothetical protein
MPKSIVIMFGIILGVMSGQGTSSVAATSAQTEPTIGATGWVRPTSLAAKCTLKRYRRPHLKG